MLLLLLEITYYLCVLKIHINLSLLCIVQNIQFISTDAILGQVSLVFCVLNNNTFI